MLECPSEIRLPVHRHVMHNTSARPFGPNTTSATTPTSSASGAPTPNTEATVTCDQMHQNVLRLDALQAWRTCLRVGQARPKEALCQGTGAWAAHKGTSESCFAFLSASRAGQAGQYARLTQIRYCYSLSQVRAFARQHVAMTPR